MRLLVFCDKFEIEMQQQTRTMQQQTRTNLPVGLNCDHFTTSSHNINNYNYNLQYSG